MGLLDAFSKHKKDEEEELALPPPPSPKGPSLPPLPETISVQSPEDHEELELPEQIETYRKPGKVPEPPISQEEQILPHRDGPLYVSVQDYQAILENLNNMKSKLKEADESFDNLNKLKSEQKAKFDSWRKNLEDVQKKLTYVDEVIFGKI